MSKKTLFFVKEGLRVSLQATSQDAACQVRLTLPSADYHLPSPAGSTFQPMHTLTNTYTMLHAKASVEKEEYQLSIKYMLSFPDAVRLQVINFTFERFPITNACAPLITKHQQGRGKPQNSCSTFRGNRTKGIND